jgi:formylglycine-generating enzyme required for sulfatase activity/CHAT domain-containing protein
MRFVLCLVVELAVAAALEPAVAEQTPCDLRAAVVDHQRLDNMLSQKFDHYVYGSKPSKNFVPTSFDTVIGAIPPRAALLFYQLSSDEYGEFDIATAISGSMRESLRDRPPRYLCTWLIERGKLVAEAVTPLEFGSEVQALSLADGIRASLRRGDETRGWRSPEQTNVVMATQEANNSYASEPPWLVLHAASDLLLPRPIRDVLLQNGYQRIFIVPSRNLGSIPFAALPVDGARLLVDIASVLIVPSFKSFEPHDAPGQRIGKRRSLVIGDPELGREDKLVRRGMFSPLPGARDEAQRVAEMLGTMPLIGAAASQKAVLRAIRQSDLIYFATHGVANDRDPNDRSYLLLSDGALTARKIAKLGLDRTGKIVVMSACQTGLGKTFESGVIGLAKAWHYAGVPTVVMTLWSVFDAPTRDLMVDFMKSLQEMGVPADIALRKAMLKARERAPHPVFWSGFAVYGDPLAEPWNPEPPASETTLTEKLIDEAVVQSTLAAIAKTCRDLAREEPDNGSPDPACEMSEEIEKGQSAMLKMAKPDPAAVAAPRCVDADVSGSTRCLKPGDSFKDCDDCPEMTVVPAGEFIMGSPWSNESPRSDERPQRKVSFAKPFAVGKFELTFAEWDACVRGGGCKHKPYSPPRRYAKSSVTEVSWDAAKEYLGWLSSKTGKKYRLLTEAEWEYAARAGTTTDEANVLDPNGTAPNALGLHDMHGNAMEWTEDCYRANYLGAPTDGSAVTSDECGSRVVRSGDSPSSAHRDKGQPWVPISYVGFRVARALPVP